MDVHIPVGSWVPGSFPGTRDEDTPAHAAPLCTDNMAGGRVELARPILRATPLLRLKVKSTVKNTVCMSLRLAAYGEFDCEFAFDSQEWSCSNPSALPRCGMNSDISAAPLVRVKAKSQSQRRMLSPKTLTYDVFDCDFPYRSHAHVYHVNSNRSIYRCFENGLAVRRNDVDDLLACVGKHANDRKKHNGTKNACRGALE